MNFLILLLLALPLHVHLTVQIFLLHYLLGLIIILSKDITAQPHLGKQKIVRVVFQKTLHQQQSKTIALRFDMLTPQLSYVNDVGHLNPSLLFRQIGRS